METLRTIILAFWDGEEQNLIGSTHFVDSLNHSSSILAYVNVDALVSNWYPDSNIEAVVEAIPILKDVVSRALSLVHAPYGPSWNYNDRPAVLGDGSDYCSFVNHLGIASIGFQVGSPKVSVPNYHSRYDSFHQMDTLMDPGFWIHRSLVSVIGLMMYDLATSPVVSLSPVFVASEYKNYKQILLSQFPALKVLQNWPFFDNAISDFTLLCKKAESSMLPSVQAVFWNLDRDLLTKDGLPGRPYFRHVMQAPNLHNDYNSQVFPGVAYYARSSDLDMADEELFKIIQKIEKVSQKLAKALPFDSSPPVLLIVLSSTLPFFVVASLLICCIWKRRQKKQYEILERTS